MKKARLIAIVLLALVMVLALGLTAACEKHECQHVCPTCGKCTSDCTDPACADKCPGHEPEHEQPTITVNPAAVEIYAGDEIDLMFGVTAKDENGQAVTVIISDDDDFDADVEGTYTITYSATDANGLTATATRTVTVNKALSALNLEVQLNRLGESKWQGNVISFANRLYVEISADTTVDTAESGVWKNVSDAEVTLSVGGGYGVSAILDANGVVLEGRDGANGRLMNVDNPDRASGPTEITIGGESKPVLEVFAQQMVIPAGGYAVVIQAGYAGTGGPDYDGRGFMNWNVIYAYGNVVRLVWADSGEALTPYVDQGPVISGHTTVVLATAGDADFLLDEAVLAGVTAKDDNGTFTPDDDVTDVAVTIKDTGGFDINTAGDYTVTLSATDEQGNETTATRIVRVTSNVATVTIGANALTVQPDQVAVDLDLTTVGNYLFILYTPEYTGEIGFSNGYGEAFVLNRFGEVVRIYDGVSAKYFDAGATAGIQDANKCTAAGYAMEAFESRQEGEYVLIAPNSSAANSTSRQFLYSNRTIGAKMSLPGVTFEDKSYTLAVNGKQLTVAEDKFIFNAEVTAATASKYGMIAYNKNYTGTFATNSHGAAIVIDQYGTLIKVYDGANLGFYDENGKAASVHFTTSNYATVAFEELGAGELLIIFPNDGGSNETRGFALGLRTDGSIGQKVTLTDFAFATEPTDDKTITVADRVFVAAEGKWAYNDDTVTAANAAQYQMIIYDTTYDGTVALNSHGAALVVDRFGVLKEIYDGANVGHYTVDGKSASVTFTADNYATIAFDELEEGELLIIFPNDGGSNAARTWALSLRGVNDTKAYCGESVELTGFTFEKVVASVTVGEATLEIDPEKVAVNVTTADVSDYDMYLFTTDFAGTVNFTNGWGIAIVMNAENEIVRVYNGADGKYYDADTPDGTQANATYLADALASLQNKEWMLVGANNPANQAPRDFLRNNVKAVGATVTMPEDVQFTLADKAMVTVKINDKAFYSANVAVNAEVTNVANYDFIVYSYGHDGIILSNGHAEVFVFNAEGKVVRIYDGVNGKYYDADNTAGIANSSEGADPYYDLNTVSLDAFLALQPGETMIVGPNGGLDSNRARAFLVGNRVYNATLTLSGVTVTPETEEVTYATITVSGKTYYQTVDGIANNAHYEGTPAFAVYDYGYTGERYTGGYGVAFIIDKATGKTVKIYDGASGKYWDADNNGVVGICTAAGYADEAFNALEEGQYVLIAPNGGSAGNTARGLLYGSRAVGVEVVVTIPEATEPVPQA